MGATGVSNVPNQPTNISIKPVKWIDPTTKLADGILFNRPITEPPQPSPWSMLSGPPAVISTSAVATDVHIHDVAQETFSTETRIAPKKPSTNSFRTKVFKEGIPAHIKGSVSSILGKVPSALNAILLRIKMNPAGTVGLSAAPQIITRMGTSIATISIAISLTEIGIALADTVLELRKLRLEGTATPKNVFTVIFKQFLPHKPLLKDLVALASGAVSLARIVGTTTNSFSPAVLNSLAVASAALGIALGALTSLLGAIITFVGIKDAIQAGRKLYHVNKEIASFKQDGTIINFLDKTRLETTSRIQQRELTKGILTACLGSFVTAAGALGIASVFTLGWAAIGIVVAGIALGVIATGVSIGGAIYQHKATKKIEKNVDAELALMDKKLENPNEWKTIIKQLVEDGFVEKKFGISGELSSADKAEIFSRLENYDLKGRKALLKEYCLSPEISKKTTQEASTLPTDVNFTETMENS